MGGSLPSNRELRRLPLPPASVHELRVSLGAGDDHVHPDPHGLGRRRHHVVEPVVGLHAEGQRGVGALRGSHDNGEDLEGTPRLAIGRGGFKKVSVRVSDRGDSEEETATSSGGISDCSTTSPLLLPLLSFTVNYSDLCWIVHNRLP